MNKEIFFIWTQGIDHIPSKMKENIEFVRQQNLDYKITIYDIEKFNDFLQDKPVHLKDNFNKLNKKCYAMIADYMRIVLLYFNGGVYMDIKSRPKKPLNTFILENKCYVYYYSLWNKYNNNFIASNKNNTFLKDLLDKFDYNINNYHSLNLETCANWKIKVLKFIGAWVFNEVIENNDYDDLIKVSNKDRIKYIQFSFVKNHHKYYKDYTKFKEPLVI
tara:strand:+ start:2745 stop:3398 length:654 start_codon:yes stop_codon:yes gene_type:complete